MCKQDNKASVLPEQVHPAFCGFDCGLCPIFQATVNDDDALREKLAEKYSTPEKKLAKADIFCMGCKAEKRYIHPFCEVCAIRICAVRHAVQVNCGECADYPCALISQRIPQDSPSRRCMDEHHRYHFGCQTE